MGQLYQRGRIYWVKYYVDGRPVRESTGCVKEQEARRVLKAREGDAAKGLPMLPRANRVRYDEAAAALRQHYATTGSRGTVEAGWRLAHLDAFFAGRRLASIGPQDGTAYAAKRQGEGAANGTINRELAVLGRMLRLAVEHNKLMRVPVFRKLKEAAPRAGFFEPAQYEAVRRRLPEDLQLACAIAYTYGWRMRSEVLTLRLSQVDLKAARCASSPA